MRPTADVAGCLWCRQWRDADYMAWSFDHDTDHGKIAVGVCQWCKLLAPFNQAAKRLVGRGGFDHNRVTGYGLWLQYRMQYGLCEYCEKPVLDDFHPDHVIPVSRGGTSDAINLVIACPSCNLSKGAKTLEEWGASRKHPSRPIEEYQEYPREWFQDA